MLPDPLAYSPTSQGKVGQEAPGLAGVVLDVIWQKYNAICHVVLPLRARREVGKGLVVDLGK